MLKYRILMMIAWLAVPFIFAQRILTGKDSVKTFIARLGFGTGNSVNPRLIWLHAASLGEFNTLYLLLPTLGKKFTNYDLLISVSNKIAFEKAKLLRSHRIHVEIAPVDFNSVVKKFLNQWNPSCLITIENEVYPNRTVKCAQNKIPIIFVNARMSEKSFNSWAKSTQLSKTVFGCIDYCFAQDQKSLQRFMDLGVASNRLIMLGNLKQFQEPVTFDHPDLENLRVTFPYKNTLCAASTHKGEDQIILDAFKLAKKINPNLKLILAPRHTKRSQEIESLITLTLFDYAVRSKNQMPTETDDIYLVDTMGEMPLWYSAAAVTFVAGSLVPVGGHTPFEPAAYDSAIIHGSQYSNFQAIYEQLVATKGSLQADNPKDIAASWLYLLDPEHHEKTLEISKTTLFENNDKDKILNEIAQKIASFL